MLQQKELLTSILNKDNHSLTTDERAIRQLYGAVDDFRQVSGAFSLLLPITMPLEPIARSKLGLSEDAPINYRALRRLKPDVMEALQNTLASKQDRIADYSEAEQRNAHLAYQLSLLESVGANNTLFRIIPPLWEGEETWYAPWDVLQQSLAGPATQQFFDAWENTAKAYQHDDPQAWQTAVAKLQELTAQARPAQLRTWAMPLEITLNQLAPFDKSLWLIIAGFIVLALAQWRSTRWVWLSPCFHRGAQGFFFIALGLQGSGIALRMAILMRPPVSTLYESTLFVSFMALACGLLLSHLRKNNDGLIVGSGLAALLLMASKVFGADGDTLMVLVAVLDTNFWLATHVVCITTGYAATLVAGMMAHLTLLRRVITPHDKYLPQLDRLHKTALFALLFTAVGTMLGGVWADQSWGRFWGWDPKENGALWIVLWLIWMVHGRIAGQLGSLGFTVGMAFVTIVVALAWFGVNLLNVGLHSYGFTDTAAYGLFAFCGGEFLLIAALTAAYFYRERMSIPPEVPHG
jgi:ABC-type transport system involved in cytochrome c biogenesis permease subunit